jgi:hypothetical protein
MPPISILAGLRASIGVGAWAAPSLTGKMFGLKPDENPQSPYLARLFGIRDIALGAGTLASSGKSRSLWLQLGVACDAADAAAGFIAGRDGSLSKPAAALVTGTALTAVALGVAALMGAGGDSSAESPAL